ncbi:Protease m1 zinc metalloprotease [Operophtera brumata]|uniref:Protease m1 zinc metalloprotease n=1 Tax=Operophtera brumata TaxID=104452 RepID=A0A0L7KNC6_OPEBR|nr:Protease m1 zinc metalloprotease [Operophtera brumata]
MSWWVPLVIIKEDNLDFTQTTPEVWTKEKELKIRNMPGKDQFIIVNPEEIELKKEEKEDEVSWKTNLRTLTKNFLCQSGYKPCIKEAQEQYAKISNQYICPVFKYGTMKEWDFGLHRVINFPPSRKQSERTYLLKNLAGCPVDTMKTKKLLNITLMEGNDNFTETDLFMIFNMLTGSSDGYTTLLIYLHENFPPRMV